MFMCVECDHKFKNAASAEKASLNGCPNCGGVDIDLDAVAINDSHHPSRQEVENLLDSVEM